VGPFSPVNIFLYLFFQELAGVNKIAGRNAGLLRAFGPFVVIAIGTGPSSDRARSAKTPQRKPCALQANFIRGPFRDKKKPRSPGYVGFPPRFGVNRPKWWKKRNGQKKTEGAVVPTWAFFKNPLLLR